MCFSLGFFKVGVDWHDKSKCCTLFLCLVSLKSLQRNGAPCRNKFLTPNYLLFYASLTPESLDPQSPLLKKALLFCQVFYWLTLTSEALEWSRKLYKWPPCTSPSSEVRSPCCYYWGSLTQGSRSVGTKNHILSLISNHSIWLTESGISVSSW